MKPIETLPSGSAELSRLAAQLCGSFFRTKSRRVEKQFCAVQQIARRIVAGAGIADAIVGCVKAKGPHSGKR